MGTILYKNVNGKLFFVRHESECPEVSNFHCMRDLSGKIDADNDTDKQVRILAQKMGWVGRTWNVDSVVGRAMMGKREFKLFKTE